MTAKQSGPDAPHTFFKLLAEALADGSFVKLTLGRHVGTDRSLHNVLVRPVTLRVGPRLSLVFRHTTRDITKNLDYVEGAALLRGMVGQEFQTAHLFTTRHTAQLECLPDKLPHLTTGRPAHTEAPDLQHDRSKQRAVLEDNGDWLHALGVTTAAGKVTKGMEAKHRQIHKFAELLAHLLDDLPARESRRLSMVDMGCGKGYLTFAAYETLRSGGWSPLQARGIELRPELVAHCNSVARAAGFDGLQFEAGDIANCALEQVDVLVALHACDTATDDAIAKGIQANASLIVVAPCCHKELRPQLTPPAPLTHALSHGILLERQAEFVTDALRAELLEWAGYRTKVFEFVSTEHTAKNLMIAAVKRPGRVDRDPRALSVRQLAGFYGITSQSLAKQLQLELPSLRR